MNTLIPVKNNDIVSAIRGFLRDLFEIGLVDAIYVPLEANGAIVPALVTDLNQLKHANPLAPVMPINGARAVSVLTGKHPSKRLGIVLRPCEMRALIELVKLQQASLEGAVLIGIDCPGTYEIARFMENGGLTQNYGSAGSSEYLVAAKEGRSPILNGLNLRPACQMCTQPIPLGADFHLHLFGVDCSEHAPGIPVTIKDDVAAKIAEQAILSENNGRVAWLTMNAVPPDDGQKAVIEKLIATRQQVRQKELTAIHNRLSLEGGMLGLFATCIRCHNCMTACPICYCKTCLFKTASFDHAPEHYFNSAKHKGAQRMLGDTILFQMTRMNHMSASCVSCGMCTSACPSEIPVGMIFSAVGESVQSAFDYVPGRDVAEQLPLITFQPNEWTEVGEAR